MSWCRSLFSLVVVVFVGAVIFGAPAPAQAAFQLRIKYGDDLDFRPAETVTAGPPGTLFNEGATSLTIVAEGSTSLGYSFADLNVSGMLATGKELTVQLTFTDLLTAPSPQSLAVTYTDDPAILGVGEAWINKNNAAFGLEGGVVKKDFTSGDVSPDPNGVPVTGSFSATPSYSLTLQLHFSSGAARNLGSDLLAEVTPTTTAVPAPSGLVLVLGGAPFWGFVARWRRRQHSAA